MRASFAALLAVMACAGPPAAPGSDGTQSTDGSGSSAAAPSCGNGVVEAPEECDDANATSGDACDADCRLPAEQLWSFDRHENPLEPFAIAVDAQGMPYVAGKRQINTETSSAWLAKFTPGGELLWEWTDGPGPWASTHASALWIRDDGSVVATAAISGFGVIVHLDAGGTEIQREGFDGLPWALVASQTDVFAAGERATLDTPDDYDAVLVRYDAAGEPVWTQTFAAAAGKNDGFFGLALDADGVLVAGGWADGVPDSDPFALRLSKHTIDGALVWEVIDDGDGLGRQIRGLDVDDEGTIFATGWSADAAGARGIFVTAYEGSGTKRWEQVVREHAQSQGNAIVVTQGGGLAVAGFASVNEYDGWLGRFDTDGLMLSSLTVDGAIHGGDFASDAFVGTDGTLVVAYGLDNDADADYIDYDLRVTGYSR